MSIIYKSLKEIRAMKGGPAKGGGLGPMKQPGGSKTLIILICVLVAASLALGGVWFYVDSLDQQGPGLSARPPRPRPSAQTPDSSARPAPDQTGAPSQAGRPGAAVPANASARRENQTVSVTETSAPTDDKAANEGLGSGTGNGTGNITGNATDNVTDNVTGNGTEKAKAGKNASRESKTYDVKIPAEPPAKMTDDENDSLQFISKVRRNQMVMEIQTKMDQARRRHDPDGVRHHLGKIEKLLGPDSFLVLQWQGNLAVLDKEYDLAEQRYRRALTLKPQDVHCRMNLVLALIGAKKFPMAERELARIERDYPEDPRTTDLRALLNQSKRYKPMKPLVNDLHNASVQSNFDAEKMTETVKPTERTTKPAE